MSDLREKTIRTEQIYDGKIIRVQVDDVELPNGNRAKREIVRHSGAVAVIAITSEGRMVFVRQFRKPLDQTILEIPAGRLEAGEDPADCAKREMIEETGYRAEQMKFVTKFYTSPGFADELLYIYEGVSLTKGEAQPDQDEFVELVELTLDEAFERIEAGEIIDAKTILAVYHWQNQQLKQG
ncbi:NUDIX domain-containing protein [Ammoniphilus oxalaticus]